MIILIHTICLSVRPSALCQDPPDPPRSSPFPPTHCSRAMHCVKEEEEHHTDHTPRRAFCIPRKLYYWSLHQHLLMHVGPHGAGHSYALLCSRHHHIKDLVLCWSKKVYLRLIVARQLPVIQGGKLTWRIEGTAGATVSRPVMINL